MLHKLIVLIGVTTQKYRNQSTIVCLFLTEVDSCTLFAYYSEDFMPGWESEVIFLSSLPAFLAWIMLQEAQQGRKPLREKNSVGTKK